MQERFVRTELLLGPEAMERLHNAHVAVFGLGGVGSFVAEALARSGIGAFDLIDHDTVSLSNVNRQIIATTESIGLPKVMVQKERILSINPECKVNGHECFYLPETACEIDLADFDYVVDAVDTVTGKFYIIENAQAANVPVISCMGTASKLDPLAFRVADIYDTSICPLAKIIRKECRKRGIDSLKVVYSTEPSHGFADQDLENELIAIEQPAGRHGIPGSVAFVPAVAGMIIAREVVKDLIS